jgi:acetoin utilization deacetylase AcuC-like enzyme
MHAACAAHDPGRGHPERPSRLQAVTDGLAAAGIAEATVAVVPRPASRAELERVHDPGYLDAIERFCALGGGDIDADTSVNRDSWAAARVATGAGLDVAARLRRSEADAAFVAVRPPGHHATRNQAMGFCLLNNVAVTAAALADEGERILIVDYDAHHGNGTQDIFWADPRVAYLSLHEWPLFPGTGRLEDVGAGEGYGGTVNVPLPRGATGDVYLRAFDDVISPLAAQVRPTWLIVSAGFDAHRADPLTGLALTSGDYADLTTRLVALVPAGRCILFLEGGYDLAAVGASAAAAVGALAGRDIRPEPSSSGGPGAAAVAAASRVHFPDLEGPP